jgi:hypothetical protein
MFGDFDVVVLNALQSKIEASMLQRRMAVTM